MRKYLFLIICALVLSTGFAFWRFSYTGRAQISKDSKPMGGAAPALPTDHPVRAQGERSGTQMELVDMAAKSLVWGAPTKGYALAVITSQHEYRVGQDIVATVFFKNVNAKTTTLPRDISQNSFFMEYRTALFSADGRPVKKSKKYTDLESTLDQNRPPAPTAATGGLQLVPREETKVTFKVNEWFDVEKAGTYSLVVMRQLWGWNYGFVVSNPLTFKVVNGK